MFTGITQGVFEVTDVINKTNLMIYSLKLNEKLLNKLSIGASVSVDGVCQTVTTINDDIVTFHAIQNTLKKTTLSSLQPGKKVSIERSLCLGDELGGHEVSGHVTGVAKIHAVYKSCDTLELVIKCHKKWIKYIFPQGFIAIDGSSLTVDKVDVKKAVFTLHLIPETLRLTNFSSKEVNDLVNMELDHKTRTIVDTVLLFSRGL